MSELKLKIRAGAIEMRAEGEAEFVHREGEVFTEYLKHRIGEELRAAKLRHGDPVVLVVKGDNLYLIKNFNRLGFLHVNNLTYKTSQRYIFNTFATIFIL